MVSLLGWTQTQRRYCEWALLVEPAPWPGKWTHGGSLCHNTIQSDPQTQSWHLDVPNGFQTSLEIYSPVKEYGTIIKLLIWILNWLVIKDLSSKVNPNLALFIHTLWYHLVGRYTKVQGCETNAKVMLLLKALGNEGKQLWPPFQNWGSQAYACLHVIRILIYLFR